MVKKLAVMIAVLWSLVLVSGCSAKNKSAEGGNPNEPFTLKVYHNADITSVNVFWVAEEMGFAREENLAFEDVGVVPSGEILASVVSGKIDVGGAHVNRTIAGINAGAKVKAVAAATETLKDFPHMCYVTVKGSAIQSAQDVVGKKVGLTAYGGCNEYTPYAWLQKNGIDNPKGKFEIIILPSETKLLQALEQGQVDVAGIHKDQVWVAEQGKYDLLFTDYDVWETIGGATPHYFSEKFISEHPDVVERYVRVIAKTNNWVNANREKAAEITAKWGNVDPIRVRAANYAQNAVIKPETVQVWIELLEQFGEIKPGLTPDKIYTNEFNKLASAGT